MEMKPFLRIIILLTLLISCTNKETMRTLVQIDSLLEQESFEVANTLFKSLDIPNMSEEETAYFYLLYSVYCNRTGTLNHSTDSLIQKSIDYYSHTSNKEKLIEAYCAKCVMFYGNNRSKEVIHDLKKAEEIAENMGNHLLLARVYSYISAYNLYYNNVKLALTYANKGLNCAQKENDSTWIGFYYQHKSTIFSIIDKQDSADYYTLKVIPYLPYQAVRDLPGYYSNVATYYIKENNFAKAKQYLDSSLSLKPTSHAYYLLANMYSKQGKQEKVDSFWQKALDEKDLRTRMDILQEYGDWLKKQGRYEEAADISVRLIALKDSLTYISEAESITEIQHHYDKKRSEKKLWGYIVWMFLTLSILTGIGIFFFRKNKNRVRRLQMESANIHSQLMKYHRHLQKLREENNTYQQELANNQQEIVNRQQEIASNQEEIIQLEQKIEKLRERQIEIFSKGNLLYKGVLKGNNMGLWNHHDMRAFIEFYQTKNYDFFQMLETEKKSYSLLQKIYLILMDMGKNEEEIKRIMNLSDGAFRTMRHRINKKEKDEKDTNRS